MHKGTYLVAALLEYDLGNPKLRRGECWVQNLALAVMDFT